MLQFQFPPGNDYEFKFVAEGAANLVFEVLVPPKDDKSSNIFNGENHPSLFPNIGQTLTSAKGIFYACQKPGQRHIPTRSFKCTGRQL